MGTHIVTYLFIVAVMTYFSVIEPQSVRRFIIKLLTSGCFVLLVFGFGNQYSPDVQYFLYIKLAVIFSFLGDMLLGVNNLEKINDKIKIVCYCFGALTFIVAQIIYVYNFAFYSSSKVHWYLLFILPLALLIYFLIVKVLKVSDKGRIIASSIYCIALASMLMSVINFRIEYANSQSLMALLAGIIFAVSDYSLLFKYFFNGNKKYATILTTVTYYVAQLLFAMTLMY